MQVNSPKEKIIFTFQNKEFFTRLGDIGVTFSYDEAKWNFNWRQYDLEIECTINWWCSEKGCDLDMLDFDQLEPDEYCKGCPHILAEQIISESWTSHNHSIFLQPKNIEEVRQNILKDYLSLAHNGLHIKNFFRIMYGLWTL